MLMLCVGYGGVMSGGKKWKFCVGVKLRLMCVLCVSVKGYCAFIAREVEKFIESVL